MKDLNGEAIDNILCVVVPADYISVNRDTMEALGIEIPAEIGEVQYLTNN